MLKKLFSLAGTAAVFATSALDLSSWNQWHKTPKLKIADGIMELTSGGHYNGKTLQFKPEKKYIFSGEFRLTSAPGKITGRIALIPLAGKREIASMNVCPVAGTDTILACAAPKGAKEIVIRKKRIASNSIQKLISAICPILIRPFTISPVLKNPVRTMWSDLQSP